MAKKQTRRSVSIRGTTYDRIRTHCELEGISMSEFVEQRIAAFFDGSQQPRAAAPAPQPTPQPQPVREMRRPEPVVAAPPPVPAPTPVRAAPEPAPEPPRRAPEPEPVPEPEPAVARASRREPPARERRSEPTRRRGLTPRPAPPAKARVVAERASGKGKLTFDEMQDAARFFTF